jgi:SAM-dependent methyltransferase
MGFLYPGEVNLNLGCGQRRIKDFLGCDLYPGICVDRVFDCQQRWPFEDNSVDCVYSTHLLEHLTRPMDFFKEMWRVMKPDGTVLIRCPYGLHRSAWGDMTHVRPWFPESFSCIQPGYIEYAKNLQYNGESDPAFWIQSTIIVLGSTWSKLYRWPLRAFLWWGSHNFPGVGEELWAFLKKTTREDRSRQANIVPMRIALKYKPADQTDPYVSQAAFNIEYPSKFEMKLAKWLNG